MFSIAKKLFVTKFKKETLAEIGSVKLVKKTYFLSDAEKPVVIEVKGKSIQEKVIKKLISDNETKLLTIKEASKLSGLTENQIRYNKSKNKFKWKKKGNRIYIDIKSFFAFLTEEFNNEEE